jgi:predicted Zn-dependent protease
LRGEQQLRALAERVLGACAADQAEVVITRDESALTRFASSAIHQNVFEASVDVRVRAVVGHRVGVATTNQLDERSLTDAATRAVESARVTPEDPDFPGLPSPAVLPSVSAYALATASYSAERRARDVKVICDQAIAAGLEASGAWSTNEVELGIANTRGIWAYDARTHASMKTVVMGETSSGYAERTAVDATLVDAEAAGQEAVSKAIQGRDPRPIEPGVYTVVLEPYAVGTMIDYLAYMGLGAQAFQEGRSFMSGRIGERMTGENVTLWDDGLDLTGIPVPFDFEGVPKARVMLIDRGIAAGVVYDSYTAGRGGCVSTGHALPAPNTFGPLPLNLFLATGEADRAALLRGISRGLWVTRFHYVNVVHPTRTVLTGMTRDGTFRIENGEIASPVHNLRFTQSVTDALSNVEAIGREAFLLQDELGGTRVPHLRIGEFSFSSATSFG